MQSIINTTIDRTVFIVSDSLRRCSELAAMIEPIQEVGWRGFSAEGFSALANPAVHRFDLVIVDVDEPSEQDWQLISALAEAGELPPAIVITQDTSCSAEILELGLVAYLLKPFGFEILNQAITRFLRLPAWQDAETGWLLPLANVLYVETTARRSTIVTNEASFITRSHFVLHSHSTSLLHVHPQFWVNMDVVSRLQFDRGGRCFAVLSDEMQSLIPVAPDRAEQLANLLVLRGVA